MIKKFTLVLIFFISALSSCKKTTETPAPNCLQTKVTVDNSSNSDVILYDSKNNVSKYIRTLSGSIITSEFTYNANGQVISAVYNDPDQNYIINYTFTYNSKGNMVKSVTIDNSSNTEYTTFEYTNNNKPLKETKSDGTYIRYEYDANGNNAIKEFKKDYSKEYLNFEFTKFDDKKFSLVYFNNPAVLFTINDDLSAYIFSNNLLGVKEYKSSGILYSETTTDYQYNPQSLITHFTETIKEFDSKGIVIKTTTDGSKFEYNCK